MNDLDAPDAYGHYPIGSAIDNGDMDVLHLVLSSGANPNIDLGHGWTPLHSLFDAAIDGMIQADLGEPSQGILNTIQLLLQYGADVTIKDADGQTPLDLLSTYSSNLNSFNLKKDIFRLLIPDIDNLVRFQPDS